jgi:hypothetical protein
MRLAENGFAKPIAPMTLGAAVHTKGGRAIDVTARGEVTISRKAR